MKKLKIKAFSLVELVVVITILAILSTISFVSFQKITANSRDAVRLTDMKTIYSALNIHMAKTSKFPLPDDYLEIKSANRVLSYQWYVWKNIFQIIWMTSNWVDPKDKINYTYSVNKAKNKWQMVGFLETDVSTKYVLDLSIKPVYAAENIYKDRYVYLYWDKVWILTTSDNEPLQSLTNSWELDIQNNTWTYTAYFWWTVYDEWKVVSSTWDLATKIISVQTETVPCNAETYSGFTISPMVHNEQK